MQCRRDGRIPIYQATAFPISLSNCSSNHKFPSGPAVIDTVWLLALGIGNSVIEPDVLILPILFAICSANQRLPSGPAVIPMGMLDPVGIGNCVRPPAVVILPI